MSKPTVERHAESWVLTWPEHSIGMGMDRPRESFRGLEFEVTVQSQLPAGSGHIAGPIKLDLLSSDAQSRFAARMAKRVNGLPLDTWERIVIQACTLVARDYRAPTPSVNLATYTDEDDEADEYLIPGLLPKGETTILYGDGSSAKSLMALRIALSCATGRPLPWGASPAAPVKVLYLDWETNVGKMRSRMARLAAGMGIDLPNLPDIRYRGTVRRRTIRSLTDELPSIREEIDREDIGLVVVDSISYAVNGPLVEDMTARQATNDLRQLAPATRLVIAHLNKDAADNATGPVRPFGSAYFWNGMRSGIEVRKAREQPRGGVMELGVFHRKSNDDELLRPFGLEVHFDGRDGPVEVRKGSIEDIPDLAARTSISSRITAALRRGEMDTPTIAGEIGEDVPTTRKTLERMDNITQIRAGGGRGHAATWGLRAPA